MHMHKAGPCTQQSVSVSVSVSLQLHACSKQLVGQQQQLLIAALLQHMQRQQLLWPWIARPLCA